MASNDNLLNMYFLDENFDIVIVLDEYESALWVDRYWSSGEVTIKVPPTQALVAALTQCHYIQTSISDSTMVIEDLDIKKELGGAGRDILTIAGRTMPVILERRIVWDKTYLDGLLQDAITQVMNENVISPTDTDRTISEFEFIQSTDPTVMGMSVNTQYNGENIYDVISDLCRSREIGFKVVVQPDLKFRLILYSGVNRAYDQADNPWVVFSPSFDNLSNIQYYASKRFLKTVLLVAGEEGIGNERITTTVEAPGGALTGLNRREGYTEPSVQRNVGEVTLSDEDYILQMKGRGQEEISKQTEVVYFDGEADLTYVQYGVDFFMGDVVQLMDSYGNSRESRVTEMMYSSSANGYFAYPGFTNKIRAHMLNGKSVVTPAPIVGKGTLSQA